VMAWHALGVEAAQVSQNPRFLSLEGYGRIDSRMCDTQRMLLQVDVKWHLLHRSPIGMSERKHHLAMRGAKSSAAPRQAILAHFEQTSLVVALHRNGAKVPHTMQDTSRIGTSTHQIANEVDTVVGVNANDLQKIVELHRTAMHISDDNGSCHSVRG